MNFLHLKDGVKVPVDFDATLLVIRNDVEIVHIRMKPGQKQDLHKNPLDVIFFVLEGKGNFTCGDKTYTFGKNSTISVEKAELRAWENKENEELVLLVIKLTGK